MKANRPDEQKRLGRLVDGFSDELWSKVDRDVVKKASFAKVRCRISILGIRN